MVHYLSAKFLEDVIDYLVHYIPVLPNRVVVINTSVALTKKIEMFSSISVENLC